MKKIKMVLILAALFSVSAMAQVGQIQQVKIISFTVKNQLPAVIDNWNSVPGSLLLVAQMPPTVRVEGARLVLQIRSGGAIVCGNNASNGMLVDKFTTRSFSAQELTGILSGCHDLKDGSYSICAQFFNIDRVAISNEVCKEFTVESPKETDYAPPTLITPDNGKAFTEAELQRPLMFRWTPLVPKPKEPITYRLRVWQLMQGQNGMQAMRSNQPIITKDVDNITQAVVTGIITGPCRPPYMCDFIWDVQAVNREGKPMGRNEGTSEPWTFKVNQTSEANPPVNISPENKKGFSLNEATGAVTFKWKPVDPQQPTPITYRLRVWQLMQGQNGTQAMKTNQPVVTKEVNNNTEVIVNGVITGPCKPPYMCDFIWDVEAIMANASGQPGKTLTSEPTTFSVKETGAINPPVNITPPVNNSFSLGEAKGAIKFTWKGVDPKQPGPITYRLRVWQLMQGQNGIQAMKSNQPVVTKEVNNNTEVIVNGVITGPCKPPYMCDFVWEVQALNREGKPVGNNEGTSEATTFTVQNNGEVPTGPINVFPEDRKSISLEEAKNSITFKWKPVEPRQQGITYKLKVWQLMQGQTGTQAMKSNQPLATLDVDGNGQTDALTDGIIRHLITGPCKPPYMCDFVWNVQAVNKEGHSVGGNDGTSEPTTFMVSQYIIQLDSIKVACTANPTTYTFSYTITNPNPGTAKLTNLVVTSSIPAGATITGFTPLLNTNIASGAPLTITGTINSSVPLTNICIGAEITDLVNTFWKASKDTCINVAPCKCDACNDKTTNINIVPTNNIVINGNNTITINQPITITTTPPKLVKSIKAELVYFEFVPESEDCLPCNKDSKTFGNFDNGTLAATGGTGGGTHSLQWNFSPMKNFAGGNTAAITITLPPTVGCCSATIRWCIRYVVTFEDCTVCNKLVCYEKKKEGCGKGNPNPNNDPK